MPICRYPHAGHPNSFDIVKPKFAAERGGLPLPLFAELGRLPESSLHGARNAMHGAFANRGGAGLKLGRDGAQKVVTEPLVDGLSQLGQQGHLAVVKLKRHG